MEYCWAFCYFWYVRVKLRSADIIFYVRICWSRFNIPVHETPFLSERFDRLQISRERGWTRTSIPTTQQRLWLAWESSPDVAAGGHIVALFQHAGSAAARLIGGISKFGHVSRCMREIIRSPIPLFPFNASNLGFQIGNCVELLKEVLILIFSRAL